MRAWKLADNSRSLSLDKKKRPQVVFLMETKLLASKFEGIRCKLRFGGCFVVDLMGRKGGLALLWEKEVDIEIINYSQHHIHAKMCYPEKKFQLVVYWSVCSPCME